MIRLAAAVVVWLVRRILWPLAREVTVRLARAVWAAIVSPAKGAHRISRRIFLRRK